MNNIIEQITTTTATTWNITNMLIGMLVAFIIGLIISLTYLKTVKSTKTTESLALTLIIIPMVISLIIALIGNNVASAFSLAGAFSIVRFRSEPGDPKDIGYIFFAMAGGLACGVELYLYGLIFTAVLCLLMYILNTIKFGQNHGRQKILKILLPENYDYEGVFDDLFTNYTHEVVVSRVKTVDLGSLFEISYIVVLKDGKSTKEFLDQIRCRNGNLTVTLSMI